MLINVCKPKIMKNYKKTNNVSYYSSKGIKLLNKEISNFTVT